MVAASLYEVHLAQKSDSPNTRLAALRPNGVTTTEAASHPKIFQATAQERISGNFSSLAAIRSTLPLPHGRKRQELETHLIRCPDSEVFLLQIHLSRVEPEEVQVIPVLRRLEMAVAARTVATRVEVRIDQASGA